jgi:filamentous hemagglutinin family protein
MMHIRAILLMATMLHGASVALAQDSLPPNPAARALPGGADVVHGTVTFDRSNPGSLRVIQSTDRAIVNWLSFDIAADNSVVVAQQGANAAALFRVTGNTDSQIAGTLTANGQLFLINPNGIAITKGARIDAGSFVASTLDIADADFLSGTFQFRRNGQARGVANAGTITAGSAVALLGSNVVNEGVVSARIGRRPDRLWRVEQPADFRGAI